MRRSFFPLLLGTLLLLTACFSLSAPNGESPAATPRATASPSASPQAIPPPEEAAQITTTVPLQTFIIWLPADLAGGAAPGSSLLLEQLSSATAGLADVQTVIEIKAVSGQGGILSYLRTGRNIAPSILPDLVILRTDQLTTALTENLIQPLNPEISLSIADDLFPAAQRLGQVGNSTAGYPFALTGMTHLAYNSQALSSIPSLWDELAALEGQSFVFPATGRDAAVLALQLYLSGVGTLMNDAGQPAIQQTALSATLQKLAQARSNGFVLPQSTALTSLLDSWQLFGGGSATTTIATPGLFISGLETDAKIGFAPIPGINGRLTPLVQGWAWAITTPEPGKRSLAASVIISMTNEARLGAWSFESGIVPARRAALEEWPLPQNGYLAFLERELELADAFPPAANITLMTVVGNAVFDVVSLTTSPQVAAEEALATLQQ